MRAISVVAPGWWDYTTLDRAILDEAARLTPEEMLALSRPGFTVKFYETVEDFYLAEALEYITAWRQATPEQPAGICGPIGPTEQLPLVARLVNELEIDLRYAHFWGMDEWVVDGKEAPMDFQLSFARADMELCFNRIRPDLRMPRAQHPFPSRRPDGVYRQLEPGALHGHAGWAGGGQTLGLQRPAQARAAVGGQPAAAGRLSPTHHACRGPAPHDDHPKRPDFGRGCGAERADPGHQRRACRDLARRKGLHLACRQPRQSLRPAPDHAHDRQGDRRSAVPMSLLAEHPNVQFNFLRSGIGVCEAEMH